MPRRVLASCQLSTLELASFAFRHIDDGADELEELAAFIEKRMARGTDVPDRSVGQKDPVLGGDIDFFADRLLKSPGHPIAILGVDSLSETLASGQAISPIQSEDPEHLVRAVEHGLAAGIPDPTAGTRELLRFGQVRLAALQLFLGQFLLDGHTGKMRDVVDDLLIAPGQSARLAPVHCER